MREWKKAIVEDPSASLVVPGAGSKRKAVGVCAAIAFLLFPQM